MEKYTRARIGTCEMQKCVFCKYWVGDAKLHMIPNGTVLDIYEERQAANENYWGYTYYDGVEGWIALTQVEF